MPDLRLARGTEKARNGGEGGIQLVACWALHDLAELCSDATKKALGAISLQPHTFGGLLGAQFVAKL